MSTPPVSEVIALIQDCDIVYLVFPDRSEFLIKGDGILKHIVQMQQTHEAQVCRLPVSSQAEAEIIAAAMSLFEEGNFNFGVEARFCQLLAEARGK